MAESTIINDPLNAMPLIGAHNLLPDSGRFKTLKSSRSTAGEEIESCEGGGATTVTVVVGVILKFPTASKALAERECEPDIPVVFQT